MHNNFDKVVQNIMFIYFQQSLTIDLGMRREALWLLNLCDNLKTFPTRYKNSTTIYFLSKKYKPFVERKMCTWHYNRVIILRVHSGRKIFAKHSGCRVNNTHIKETSRNGTAECSCTPWTIIRRQKRTRTREGQRKTVAHKSELAGENIAPHSVR